jgi:NAD(P)-dependent dehydrogenase (short-subunit alcohol dehydrogenase family)
MTTTNDVTIVTGANGALGAAVVQHRVAAGDKVIGLERAKSGEAASVTRVTPSLVKVHANLTDPVALRAALARAEAEVGAVTGAVLTAGAWRGGTKFTEPQAADDFRFVMDANLESANSALRAILPGLVQRKHGSVVLIGSRSGVRPYDAPGDAAYAATKAALGALAQAVAAEVLADGVRVNLVLPSTIDTAANRQAMPDADRSRWVTTDSLAGVIGFLLSEQARDISGAAIPVYGRVNV